MQQQPQPSSSVSMAPSFRTFKIAFLDTDNQPMHEARLRCTFEDTVQTVVTNALKSLPQQYNFPQGTKLRVVKVTVAGCLIQPAYLAHQVIMDDETLTITLFGARASDMAPRERAAAVISVDCNHLTPDDRDSADAQATPKRPTVSMAAAALVQNNKTAVATRNNAKTTTSNGVRLSRPSAAQQKPQQQQEQFGSGSLLEEDQEDNTTEPKMTKAPTAASTSRSRSVAVVPSEAARPVDELKKQVQPRSQSNQQNKGKPVAKKSSSESNSNTKQRSTSRTTTKQPSTRRQSAASVAAAVFASSEPEEAKEEVAVEKEETRVDPYSQLKWGSKAKTLFGDNYVSDPDGARRDAIRKARLREQKKQRGEPVTPSESESSSSEEDEASAKSQDSASSTPAQLASRRTGRTVPIFDDEHDVPAELQSLAPFRGTTRSYKQPNASTTRRRTQPKRVIEESEKPAEATTRNAPIEVEEEEEEPIIPDTTTALGRGKNHSSYFGTNFVSDPDALARRLRKEKRDREKLLKMESKVEKEDQVEGDKEPPLKASRHQFGETARQLF